MSMNTLVEDSMRAVEQSMAHYYEIMGIEPPSVRLERFERERQQAFAYLVTCLKDGKIKLSERKV